MHRAGLYPTSRGSKGSQGCGAFPGLCGGGFAIGELAHLVSGMWMTPESVSVCAWGPRFWWSTSQDLSEFISLVGRIKREPGKSLCHRRGSCDKHRQLTVRRSCRRNHFCRAVCVSTVLRSPASAVVRFRICGCASFVLCECAASPLAAQIGRMPEFELSVRKRSHRSALDSVPLRLTHAGFNC